MNQKQKIASISKAKGLLDFTRMQHAKQNKCGFPGSLAHARKIFEICYVLNAAGLKFYTEAFLKKGGRADIFVMAIDGPVIIEVMESEEWKSIDLKRQKYPCRVVALPVDTDFVLGLIE